MRDRRLLIALLAAALIGGPAAAEVRSPQTAAEVRSLNDAARRAISQKDYGAALTAYRQAIAALRDEPDAVAERATAMFLAAVCLEKLDRPAEALLAHREALEAGLSEPLAGKARARLEALQSQVVVTTAQPTPAEPTGAEDPPPAAPAARLEAPPEPAAPEPAAPEPAAPETAAPETAARSENPEDALAAINHRAKAAVREKRWDDALAAYREAAGMLEAMPDRSRELAMTWFLVGVCLDQLERRDEANSIYARARALGPPQAILDRIAERIGPPPAEAPGVPVQLACTPGDLAITVGDLLDGAPCDALRGLPPGTWTIQGRGSDGRTGDRTVRIDPGAGDYRISLVIPPRLDVPPPEIDRRAAWVLTVGALASLAAGGLLVSMDDPDDLGPEARPVGLGMLGLGGVLSVSAAIAFATADSPRHPPLPAGWGPVGWTF